MIALLAAVPLETNLLRRYLSPCEVRNCGGRDLYLGTRCKLSVALMHSGIGKANAASAATSMLSFSRFQAMIVLGCGGAFPDSGLDIGDLALATEEIYGDEGVRAPDGFLDMEALDLPLIQRNGQYYFNRYSASAPLLTKVRTLLKQRGDGQAIPSVEGPFVTVSTCSGTLAAGLELARRTGGICENMEGAAVAQICAMHGVPFLEIRGISNLVEDRNVTHWDLKGAAENAQRAVQEVLNNWHQGKESA
ncbi:MAG: futalosine hydrolase [Desulfuromonadaceae bacterium]